MTLGRPSFGGALIPLQPSWTGGRPVRLETCEPASPFLRGLGGSSEVITYHFVARSISSSSPKFSAMRSALDPSPFRPVDETFGIPETSLEVFPSVLHPEGLRFLGVLQGWVMSTTWRETNLPPADFQGSSGALRTAQRCAALPAVKPYLRTNRFQGDGPSRRKENSSQGPRRRLRLRLRCRESSASRRRNVNRLPFREVTR